METQLLSFSKPVTMNKAINIDEMESQILKDGKDIRPSQMDKFYNRLQSSNLSKEQKLVRYKKFEKKVKRAIQLEQFSDNN